MNFCSAKVSSACRRFADEQYRVSRTYDQTGRGPFWMCFECRAAAERLGVPVQRVVR